VKFKYLFITILLSVFPNPFNAEAQLTSGNVTIKTAAGTYSSWAGFWDDLGNLTGDITCTVDASAFTEDAAPAIVTESLNSHTLHVKPASFPTKTDASDGARFTFNITDPIIRLGCEGAGSVIIEGIVFIEGTSVPGRGLYISGVDIEYNLIFRRNIIKGCDRGIQYWDATQNSGTKIYNNIIYDCNFDGIVIGYDISDAVIANNTFHNCDDNVDCGDEELTLENNLSYGGLVACFANIDSLTIGNNNANSDHTGDNDDWGGGGANNIFMAGDPFNNLGADDFTITAEGVIHDDGKDLSAYFTTDFFGVTRTNWTIGACEYEAGASSLDISTIEGVTEVSTVEYTEMSTISP